MKVLPSVMKYSGSEVYMNIAPFWGGDTDDFNIKSAEDAAQFPNLSSVTLLYDETGDAILKAFQAKGIEANWL